LAFILLQTIIDIKRRNEYGKEKNKWKIAFWWYFAVSIVLLLFMVGFSAYHAIDKAYTIAYNSDGWAWDRNDKDDLAAIINIRVYIE
jgi:heme/copper-type cytochrome/quinol oxidase subunit 2